MRRRLGRSTLVANLERETQARLEAEKTVAGQAKYIEAMPYPSDVYHAEEMARAWQEEAELLVAAVRRHDPDDPALEEYGAFSKVWT